MVCAGKCIFSFDCTENKERCIENRYNNNFLEKQYCQSNDDCLSLNCINNQCIGNLLTCSVGEGKAKCGLKEELECKKDIDCFSNNCSNGICARHSMIKELSKGMVPICIGGATLLIFAVLACCYFYRIKKNSINSKNDQEQIV